MVKFGCPMVKFGCHMVALGAWILGMTWQVAGEQLQCQEIRTEHFCQWVAFHGGRQKRSVDK